MDFRSAWNETELFYAIRKCHTEMVTLALERTALLVIKLANGTTPRTTLADSKPEMLLTVRQRQATDFKDSAVPGAS